MSLRQYAGRCMRWQQMLTWMRNINMRVSSMQSAAETPRCSHAGTAKTQQRSAANGRASRQAAAAEASAITGAEHKGISPLRTDVPHCLTHQLPLATGAQLLRLGGLGAQQAGQEAGERGGRRARATANGAAAQAGAHPRRRPEAAVIAPGRVGGVRTLGARRGRSSSGGSPCSGGASHHNSRFVAMPLALHHLQPRISFGASGSGVDVD